MNAAQNETVQSTANQIAALQIQKDKILAAAQAKLRSIEIKMASRTRTLSEYAKTDAAGVNHAIARAGANLGDLDCRLTDTIRAAHIEPYEGGCRQRWAIVSA